MKENFWNDPYEEGEIDFLLKQPWENLIKAKY